MAFPQSVWWERQGFPQTVVCLEDDYLHLDIDFSFHLDTSYSSGYRETETIKRVHKEEKWLKNGVNWLRNIVLSWVYKS